LRKLTETDDPMTNSEKYLFQVRLSEAERRQIRTLAASQGLTH
jgi:hypothetical protein